MEKLSYREHVLRGFGSRRSFGNPRALPKTPQRNSDIDFHDVFGGPPRCSMTEVRHSLGESVDSYSFTGGEETPPPRSPWSALSEKPVFGGDSPSRRRHLSNDFFDDIFKGDDSSSSTPRKPDRDIFSSSSASWISSPTRPLPPNRQPFTGGSSLPAHLSLSMKLPKGMDLPTFRSPCRSPIRNKDGCGSNGNGFPSSPSIGASRLAIETVVGQDDSRKGTRSSHHHIPLSHGFSVSGDVSGKAAESDRQDTQGQFVAAESDRQDTQGQFVAAASDRQDTQGQFVEKDRGSSEASNDNNQFHFSIYKWASKGVMLMMPAKGGNRSNAKERGKNESIVSGLPAPVLRGANLPSLVEIASTASTSFEFQCDSQDNVSSKGIKIIIKDNDHEDAEHPEPEASPAHNLDSHITEESGRGNTVRSSSSAGPPDIGLFKGVKEHKSETKSLGSLLMCRSDDTGMVEVIKPAGQQDGFPKLKTVSGGKADDSVKGKKPIGRKPILIHAETTHSNLHDEPLNSDEKMPGNRVKEKVKEFVKIFNQEASPNLMHAVDTRGHSFRRKEPGSCKVEDPVPVYATMVDRQDETNNENDGGILADTPVMVDEIVKQTVKKHTVANADANKIHDSSSERNDIPESYPESTPKEELENTEESHCEDLHVHCLVEQLPGCQKENPQPNRHQDDIKVSDAKVREWSSGKEGNIRSLLSTLQYVLWPDSGWKPVPLAEIIEGTSVRRAYQKALLCLHPDKLQQRGAAVHQKYIAEKVFDILQEAWDHFNSVNPI